MGVKGKILLHNEYVIYREAQQRLKYIIEFEAVQKIIKEECGMNYMDYNIADLKFMKMRRIPVYKSNPYDSFGLTIFEIKENLSMGLLSIS